MQKNKVFNNGASASNVVAKPLRFVYYDEKGKLKMDAEAFATLQLVKGPIGVVSVCGQAGQGKGFVLNRVLSRSSGFQVDSSSHQPISNGIWMWSEPARSVALDGTEYNLLLLDSEIDACDDVMDSSQPLCIMGTYRTKIISLSALLSSMFIYNQMSGIDEAAIDRVSVVTEMIKCILIRASGDMNIPSELGHFSPIFVWLLRDFCLDLAEDNSKITPRDYLELTLMPFQSGGKDTIAKNEIRESILALFRDQECFALVRPLNDENEPQLLDQISLDKLCPEFRSGLDSLIKFVFERTRALQVGSRTMSGPILADLTQSFLDALNNGAVPGISPSWQAVESTMKDYNIGFLARQLEIKELTMKLGSAKVASQLFEKKARILEQEKTHLEQKYMSNFKGFEEVQERCKLAEKYAKSVIELSEKARSRKKYLSLENGRFWFPAQVFNRNHQIEFIMSCYDAEVCYDSLKDTFQARYLHYDPRVEEGVQWDRIRAPPVDTPYRQLHVSDCRNDLYPGDHIEIQWSRSRQCLYGWLYGVIGHLETCQKENLCLCYHSDKVVVEFNQYSAGSRWRQMIINRKGHREEGDGIRGFYGAIRKLYCEEEISVWTRLLPKVLLQ